MDRFYGKRTVGGLCVPKKTSGLVLRDADKSNGDAQFCNRLGCSGRLKYTKATQVGNPRNSKSLRPSTHSASAKEIGGRISSSSSVVNNAKIKLSDSCRKLRSGLETKNSGSSSSHDEIDSQELSVSQRTNMRGFQSNLIEAESGTVASVKAAAFSVPILGGKNMRLSFDEVLYPSYEIILPGEGMPKSKEQGMRSDLRPKVRLNICSHLELCEN